MIPLGLTSQQRGWLEATLASSHAMRVTVTLQNLAGSHKANLSKMFDGGQITVDMDADVTRSAQITLVDPQGTLSFDSDSPSDTAMYLDDMIAIEYGVFVPQLDRWVDIPVFTGPIVKLERDEETVTIEAQGKESLAMGAAWRTFTRKKGTNRLDAIKDILRVLAGETRFNFENSSNRIGKDVAVGRETVPWNEAKRLTKAFGKQIFYDGDGVCRLRSYPQSSVFTFREGDGGTVVTTPKVSYDSSEVKNIIWVKGGLPKGAKKKISVHRVAPTTHPLNPSRLGRNGVPRYLLEVVEDDTIRSKIDAQVLGDQILYDRLLQSIEVKFDAMPIPHLEPGDLVTINTGEYSATFRLRAFSIPLVAGDAMQVGYTKRIPPKKWTPKKKPKPKAKKVIKKPTVLKAKK